MTRLHLAFWLFSSSLFLHAQNTVFLFDWEGSDPKVAAIGPNATSIGNLIVTKTRLDNRTKGLAPPAGTTTETKQDINMVLANNPIFNRDGIDLSFDYQRDESTATLISRNNFQMGANGMNARYRVREASGGCSAQIVIPGEAIVDDDIYRTYRFRYDPNTGEAVLSKTEINGPTTVIGTNATKTPGQALCWDGDTDITIGIATDGSGKGNAIMDNLRMEEVGFAGLPVELTVFEARALADRVELSWRTDSEVDNDYFAIERSCPGEEWMEVVRQVGYGNTNETYDYVATDESPRPDMNYYRLKQVDYDGNYGYSTIKSVRYDGQEDSSRPPFPNPTYGTVSMPGMDRSTTIHVINAQGQAVKVLPPRTARTASRTTIDLSGLPTGVYHIHNGTTMQRVIKQ
ncbi:hypothetical protein LEM8419_02300 [Neolewinella maritima]|uniref:Secretion system C-terminal sorting domain-containing protein n=1 Tax=Neolewinella maritima TaxID=1383882 RepID=A0ABN8F8W2_9BACT|nr:T9SS type A sorting domain-containing protein [Neolewinella maritima]CAH1001397.1 hypothetical protein LEM8419_02300 [Neolewinella maritima]